MITLSGSALKEQLLTSLKSDKDLSRLSFYLFSDSHNQACFYYLKGIKKVLDSLAIPYTEAFLDPALSEADNLVRFQKGISSHQVILARPLGVKNEEAFVKSIPAGQDPDGMSDVNRGKLYSGNLDYLPATAQSVRYLLDTYQISLAGRKCLVVGRSLTVGLPLAELVNRKDGLLTLAHSKVAPELLAKEAKESSVIFLASGHPGLIPRSALTPETTVLDCGFSAGGGDLGFIPNPDELKAYTPVPGGVGALTSLFLVKNALTLVKLS